MTDRTLPSVSLTNSLIGVTITYLVLILPCAVWTLRGFISLNSPAEQNLTAWLLQNQTTRGTAWGPLMAGAIITSIPGVVLFLIIQRNIATGLTAGAVKG